MQPRALRLTGLVLLGLTLAVYLGYFFIYTRYAAALITFPFDYDQGEGFELNDSVLFARAEWPYQNNEVYPFYASNYPPLYHLWFVPFVWVFGPAYWYGRLFSFLSTLITAGLIAYAVHRASRDKPISLIAGLAYLASNYVYHIGPLFRQHISMVMFETLAVVILASLGRNDTPMDRKRLVLGLLCLLAAGYTKQLAYATIAVCLLFVIWRNWRIGLIASASLGGVAAAIFGLINVATNGQWWVNIILANINEFIPGQMEGLYRQWYDLHLILIWASVLFVLLVVTSLFTQKLSVFANGEDRSNVLYALWFAGAAANGMLAGKWGAGESYFMTAIAAMCLCVGILLATWRRAAAGWRLPLQWVTVFLIPVLLVLQAGRLIHLPTQGRLFEPIARLLNVPTVDTEGQPPGHGVIGEAGVFVDSEGNIQYYDAQGYTQLGRPPNSIDTEQGYKILEYIRTAQGPVMTEEASFSLLAGKVQVGNPTQLYNLDKNSMLDSSALVEMINERAFEVIVLKAEFYPRPVLYAIGQNYESVGSFRMNGFDYRVLEPRQDAP